MLLPVCRGVHRVRVAGPLFHGKGVILLWNAVVFPGRCLLLATCLPEGLMPGLPSLWKTALGLPWATWTGRRAKSGPTG